MLPTVYLEYYQCQLTISLATIMVQLMATKPSFSMNICMNINHYFHQPWIIISLWASTISNPSLTNDVHIDPSVPWDLSRLPCRRPRRLARGNAALDDCGVHRDPASPAGATAPVMFSNGWSMVCWLISNRSHVLLDISWYDIPWCWALFDTWNCLVLMVLLLAIRCFGVWERLGWLGMHDHHSAAAADAWFTIRHGWLHDPTIAPWWTARG